MLRRVGDEVESGDVIDSVVIHFTISVQDVLPMDPIEISLEGVTIVAG